MTGSAVFSQESRSVVVAATHSGRIEILESDSLRPVGSVAVNHEVESVSASPDGRRLYVAQESETTRGCCGLFSLDLATRQMCLLTAPALFGAPSRDGRYLFTQPGSDGIDVFDAKLLAPLPRIKAPGTYSLHPSPDGQWLLGVTNTPAPSVDIFDIARGELTRRIALPSGPVMGAWVGNWFYVYSHDEGSGKLWRMDHRTTELPPAKPVHLPDLHGDCTQNLLLMMTGGEPQAFHRRSLRVQAGSPPRLRPADPGRDLRHRPPERFDRRLHARRVVRESHGRRARSERTVCVGVDRSGRAGGSATETRSGYRPCPDQPRLATRRLEHCVGRYSSGTPPARALASLYAGRRWDLPEMTDR